MYMPPMAANIAPVADDDACSSAPSPHTIAHQLKQARDGLKQNLKFAGMSAGLIGGLLLGVMASNGLL